MRQAYGVALRGVLLALRRIEQRIDELEAQGLSPGIVQVMVAEDMRRAAQEAVEAIRAFAPEGEEITATGQRTMALFAEARQERLVRTAAGERPQGVAAGALQWRSLPVDQIEAFVGLAGDGSPLRTLFDQVGVDAEQALMEAIATGEGPREAARRMRVATQGSYRRMETIARTEMMRSAREATRRTYEANADVLEGWRRVCAGDSRVCAVCWALHGQMHEVGDILPSHPQCRCVAVPVTKSWADLLGPDGADLPDTRPEVPDAESLFGRMSEADQRASLGPARWELWKSGTPLSAFGRVRNDARWGPVAEPVDLADLPGA